jgi:NAD(P)-dependent dehydrogenase (short-subunit alcohol dehydrogenase family)
MFELTGRKALVTGASGGIGEAIARVLHAQGAIVGLHGTRVAWKLRIEKNQRTAPKRTHTKRRARATPRSGP